MLKIGLFGAALDIFRKVKDIPRHLQDWEDVGDSFAGGQEAIFGVVNHLMTEISKFGRFKECEIVGFENMGFVFLQWVKGNLHLVSFCLETVWFFHMVKALVGLLLAPTLGSKAPQSPLSAPMDLHLLVVDVPGHDMPLLGGCQDGEGCSDEHPHTAWHQV